MDIMRQRPEKQIKQETLRYKCPNCRHAFCKLSKFTVDEGLGFTGPTPLSIEWCHTITCTCHRCNVRFYHSMNDNMELLIAMGDTHASCPDAVA